MNITIPPPQIPPFPDQLDCLPLTRPRPLPLTYHGRGRLADRDRAAELERVFDMLMEGKFVPEGWWG